LSSSAPTFALHYERVYVRGGEEALGNHALQLLEQCVKEAARVQQCDGLVVNLELLVGTKIQKVLSVPRPPAQVITLPVRMRWQWAATRAGEGAVAGVRMSGGTHT